MNRRNFFRAAGSLLFAPAIVKAENLMPVRKIIAPTELLIGRVEGFSFYTSEKLPIVGTGGKLDGNQWRIYIRNDGSMFVRIESIEVIKQTESEE